MAGKLPETYQLKIELVGTGPLIWRRILVASNTTLGKLHRIVQACMGWSDSHLHEFEKDGERYGPADPDACHPLKSERTQLSTVLPAVRGRLNYVYDFGDDWHHRITLEKRLPPGVFKKLPLCVEGARACPPEDCGGVWGYENLLMIIADPTHEEHREMVEWVGEGFSPEAFDADAVNGWLDAFV